MPRHTKLLTSLSPSDSLFGITVFGCKSTLKQVLYIFLNILCLLISTKALKTEEEMASPEDWQEEANAVIQDVRNHVYSISISSIPSSKKKIYFNMTILELKDFCVELTQEGFQVVGEKYDSEDARGKYLVFETLYSLLDSLSPAYRNSFSEELLLKLKKLEGGQKKEQDSEDERRPGEENCDSS